MIYYLLYVSCTNKTLSNEELTSLLAKCKANNESLGVTGMLIYLKNQFIQILEGNKETVQDLYAKIALDNRHQKVSKLLSGEHLNRNFQDWSMGFQKLMPNEFNQITGHHDLTDFFDTPKVENEKHPAVLFLKLFYHKNKSDFNLTQ